MSVKRKFKNGEDLANALPSLHVGERVIYHGVEHEVIDAGEQGKRVAALRDEKAEGDAGQVMRTAYVHRDVLNEVFARDVGEQVGRYSVQLYGNGGPDVSISLERDGQHIAEFMTEGYAQEAADALNATTQHPEPVAWRIRLPSEIRATPWVMFEAEENAEEARKHGYEVQALFLAPPADPEALRLLEWLHDEGLDLRSQTSGYDECDYHYVVIEHYMSAPTERVIGEGRTALEALREAFANQQEKGRD